MRIATFNIWNSNCGLPARTEQLIDSISDINADVICLQEVRDREYHHQIVTKSEYPYSFFHQHEDELEGLSIISKHPLNSVQYVSNSLVAVLSVGNVTISLANVHLSWDSAIKREIEIINIVDTMSFLETDYSIIAGDFNSSENSSVHRYLLGQQSLLKREANPYWYDISEAFAARQNTSPKATLDFIQNPWFAGKNTIEINQRFDRILLKNTYPKSFPILLSCNLFGTDISPLTGYAPSDHYGVCADLDFAK